MKTDKNIKTLLLVIDLQKSFINDFTKDLPNKITQLIDSNKYDDVIFTKFINNQNSIFYKKLHWNGCIESDDKKIIIDTKNYKVFEKNVYSSLSKEVKTYIEDNRISEIYLCGIDTECCILKTAFDLFEQNYNVYVLKDYCACTYGINRHNNALEILERNIGKEFII